MERIFIPRGCFMTDDPAAESRRAMRESLLSGETVHATPTGELQSNKNSDSPEEKRLEVPKGVLGNEDDSMDRLLIPSGKLASYYWYEKKPELYKGEIEAMNKFFPNFRLKKLSDGRLSWIGSVRPRNVRENAEWFLQIVYDHNHPHNNNWGGSVKIYSIEPDLTELQSKLKEKIPHMLRDASGNIYLCTSRKEDFKAGTVTTSAASALGWAIKWITVFELWLAGDVTTKQFNGHTF